MVQDESSDALLCSNNEKTEVNLEEFDIEGLEDWIQGKRILRSRSQVINYAEIKKPRQTSAKGENNQSDKPKKSRRKRRRLEYKNALQLEAEVGWYVGLNANTISEEEEGLIPPGTDLQAYEKVRNRVLTLWRSDVTQYLSRDGAQQNAEPELRGLAELAWKFLNRYGYINFGVAPAIARAPQKQVPETAQDASVIVVGAGLAGLAAASQLVQAGYRVLLLEGRNRLGGRVYTRRLEADGAVGVADLGGSIITGILGNPLAVLAAQQRIPLHDIKGETPLYMDGAEVNRELDEAVYAQFDELLNIASRYRDDLGTTADILSLGCALESLWDECQVRDLGGAAQRLIDWHMANLEFANAAKLTNLSLRTWDQDDAYEMMGAHTFVPGGNVRLLAPLAEGVPICYNCAVSEIDYSSSDRVTIKAGQDTFVADAALVTVPLGVLKRGSIAFKPSLPDEKLGAISRLGFGVLNKVVLLFPHAFWGTQHDMFGIVANDGKLRGECYLFYSYASISGASVLAALVAGEAALVYESLTTEQAVKRVISMLESAFKPKGIDIPAPLQAVLTKWGSDPFACGSYSSMAVGCRGPDDYDALAEPVMGKLFFAGEATTKQYPATMHGALYSGLREAGNIMASLKGRKKEREKAEQLARQGGSGREAAAKSGQAEKTLGRMQPSADALSHVRMLAQMSLRLDRLFALGPDLEFGSFRVLFGPKTIPAMAALALVRLELGHSRTGPRQNLLLNFVMPRDQILRVRDVRGGDDARIMAMTGAFGVQLLARTGLDARALELLEAIESSRLQKEP